MSQIKLEFSDTLERFVRRRGHCRSITFKLKRKSPIKDIIESHGVPHTEVGAILLGEKEVGFRYFPKSGDHIRISGIAPPLNIHSPSKLRPQVFNEIKFIADVNVGKAAVLLRALGFDTLWEDRAADFLIASLAYNEDRIVLTRDIDLLKRKNIIYGQFIDAQDPFLQTRLVLERYGIKGPFNLFSRCTRCNSMLEEVEKDKIIERLLPRTKKYYNEFFICPDCGKLYWKGSHREKIIIDFKKIGIDV